jgi:hypothetical protein
VVHTCKYMVSLRGLVAFLFVLILGAGCAAPIRQAYKVDESLPIGNMQGDYFLGERFRFKVRIPTGWQATTRYPEFLVEQGYGLEGLKATPFFLFNPVTQSSLQVDFSPAGRTAHFDQEVIEALTKMAGGSLMSDLEEEYGKNFPVELSKVTPLQLKGVPFAARMSARYTVKEQQWEQSWVYAFAEPYQIFIFCHLTEGNRDADRETIEHALSSFEYLGIP